MQGADPTIMGWRIVHNLRCERSDSISPQVSHLLLPRVKLLLLGKPLHWVWGVWGGSQLLPASSTYWGPHGVGRTGTLPLLKGHRSPSRVFVFTQVVKRSVFLFGLQIFVEPLVC